MTSMLVAREGYQPAPIPTPPAELTSRITSFLFFESALLDDWDLNEWLSLFDDEGRYQVLPLQYLESSNPKNSLYLVSDDNTRLETRIRHLLEKSALAEVPRSRTRRIISNIRVLEHKSGIVRVKANFVIYQFRNLQSWEFVGETSYKLRERQGALKILERITRLDHESMASQRRISIIV
ncbi:aromatic-ring-hydroxylating dioxygenase subunit beta [Methylosinus sp. Sm6]|uniref:aromatic-ring-hydroxylating dioxygenase subunit beta n=1 Tax=Methylosinus sp. Sm6 TaxID=2866948 RepID=UPI001C9902FB|nr:aromatic-ring-hydroxylating dioxygenase subunit beta [Methylosinus sp. Sm6]MBY6242332.1 hypothetical protein [Methylosinus sp. Sm6]